MSLPKLKSMLQEIDGCFVSDCPKELKKISPAEVVKDDHTQERIQRCRTAPDVFREFAADAAGAKVEEMLFGKTSSSRQRAQETVLEYALGTPIKRSASLSMNVSDMPEEEIEGEIKELMGELGFARVEGKTSRLFIGTKGSKGKVEVIENKASSGSSGEHSEVECPDTPGPGREPSW